MSDPPQGCPPARGRRLYRYEMRVRTSLGPALTATFALLSGGSVVPRHAVRRLAVIRDDGDPVDLPAVVERLTECDVAILEARRCAQPAPRRGSAP
jgi:hypothetical protein